MVLLSVNITDTFYPATRKAWRKWLEKNHYLTSEIWVVYYKKHTGKPTLEYEEAVEEALCFGWIDGIEKKIDEERFTGRFTPRKAKRNWSEINIGRYKMLVEARLMTEAGTKAFEENLAA